MVYSLYRGSALKKGPVVPFLSTKIDKFYKKKGYKRIFNKQKLIRK